MGGGAVNKEEEPKIIQSDMIKAMATTFGDGSD